MAFLGDVATCLQALQTLRDRVSQMGDNVANIRRLCRRTQIFKSVLEEVYRTRRQPTDAIVMVVIDLKVTLLDINKWIHDNSQDGWLNNLLTRFVYCNGRAIEIGAFNGRLNDCAITMNVAQGLDATQRRAEDLQDLKTAFEAIARKILTETKVAGENLSSVEQLRADIADHRAGMAALLAAMGHKSPLSPAEGAGVGAICDGLANLAQIRHKQIMELLAELNDHNKAMLINEVNLHLGDYARHGDATLLLRLQQKDGLGSVTNVNRLFSFTSKGSDEAVDMTALMMASCLGYSAVVEVLLKIPGIDVNWADKDKWTALIHASHNNHLQVVQVLLGDSGLRVNKQTEDWADPKNTDLDMFADFLQGKETSIFTGGFTALMTASHGGHTGIVHALLADRRVDINIRNKWDKSALHYASNKTIKAALRAKGAK